MKGNNSYNRQSQPINSKQELDDFIVSKYNIRDQIFLKSSKLKQTIEIRETEEKKNVIKIYCLKYITPQILNNYV